MNGDQTAPASRKSVTLRSSILDAVTRASTSTDSEALPHFLRIPRELRDRIYQLALVAKQGFIDHPPRMVGMWATSPATKAQREDAVACIRAFTALASTCHQIREEAQTCFFGRNTFCTKLWPPSSQGPLANELALHGMDAGLAHMKHVMIGWGCHAVNARAMDEDWLVVVLDVRIKGREAQIETALFEDSFIRVLPARYGGVGQVKVASIGDHQHIAKKAAGAVGGFKADIQRDGRFSRKLLTSLVSGLKRVC
ncbi:hypothetical protein LTR56_025532 [Elasticomyces elasticus]|nr:hypothetical protein LTR56_025532 [Elasticomyces elasticus]KAK3627378.1 hypothetical protein LTR22_022762 [Elasticomyces elasticus]KAK4907362.1 hypothetical protein LTR49_023598 [Elasticomyces elasticus]KAK5740077.1 hypothetical protein LTS12_025056 [Elasticomyces elasticus]